MEELQEKIVGLLEQAGGTMPYRELHGQLDGGERQGLIRVMRNMQDAGLLHQTVAWDKDSRTIAHSVVAGRKQVNNGDSV